MTTTIRRTWLVAFALSLSFAACTPQDMGSGDTTPSATGGRSGSGGARNTGGSGSGGSAVGSGGSNASGGSSGGAGGNGSGGAAGDAGMAGDGGQSDVAADDCAMANSLLCNPKAKMPMTIKATGLFPEAPDLSKRSPRLLMFKPDPPLWTDGMDKERLLLLPKGEKVDPSNAKQWAFPVGTIMVKTFYDDTGPNGSLHPIETRFIRRIGGPTDLVEYDFYLYKWNADGKDGVLVVDDLNGDDQKTEDVMITIKRSVNGKPFVINNGTPFAHTLPSRSMCDDCHRGNGLTYQTFVGFDQIRLNSKLPGHDKTQLQELHEAGVFTANPAPRAIEDADALLLKVKQFVHGNCVHCHNEKGKQFDLSPDVFVKNTVGLKTMVQSVEPPPGWLRIVPGDPEKSVVFVQARRTPLPMPTANGMNRLRPMPPFGVNDNAVDQEGLDALKAWILTLKK